MTRTLPRAPRRAVVSALAGLALLPVAGCGGDETAAAGSGDGLARFAPPTAPFYVEGTVRPEGDRKSDLDGLIAKFAPAESFEKLVTRAFDENGKVDYARDIKPWLGERAALTVTGLPAGEGDDPDVAVVVQTTDADKALAAVRKDASGKLEERSYGGADYVAETGEDTVGGIVDDALVVGTEPAFKAVVDASKGKGLDTNGDFEKVVDAVDDDAVGFLYGDLRRVFDLAKGSGTDAQQLESARELFERQGLKTFAAGMTASPSVVKIRAAAVMKDSGSGAGAAETVAGLPAGVWAAAGLGDLGRSLTQALDSARSLTGPGFNVQDGLDQLEQQAGIDVQKDLLSWMGQTGIFVRGTSLTDIGGAMVVKSKDPAATKAALAKARTLVAGSGLPAQALTGKGIDDGFTVTPANAPVQVFAALAGDRFVLAVSRKALDEAIDPATKLEDDDAFKAAAASLGDDIKPTFFLDFPKISGLIGLAAGGQTGYGEVKPYLDKIGTIAAGSKRDGDMQRSTMVINVR